MNISQWERGGNGESREGGESIVASAVLVNGESVLCCSKITMALLNPATNGILLTV
jgi:hypothetical protein